MEEKIAELSKLLQDQARFTRIVVVMCTASLAGILVLMFVQIFSLMPNALVQQFMANLPEISRMWHAIDAQNSAKVPASK